MERIKEIKNEYINQELNEQEVYWVAEKMMEYIREEIDDMEVRTHVLRDSQRESISSSEFMILEKLTSDLEITKEIKELEVKMAKAQIGFQDSVMEIKQDFTRIVKEIFNKL